MKGRVFKGSKGKRVFMERRKRKKEEKKERKNKKEKKEREGGGDRPAGQPPRCNTPFPGYVPRYMCRSF